MATDVRRAQPKVTYATMMSERMDDVHREFDRMIAAVRTRFGETYPMYIGGAPVESSQQFEDRSPIDRRILLGRFQLGAPEHVREAVAAARDAYPRWAATRWDDRVDILRRLAQLIHAHRIELSALMGYEAGKSRLECLGDVEEAADLIAYYCSQFEQHEGFVRRMDTLEAQEETISVMRPYGVWAVISPFNFPLALAAGPAGAALVTGNTVVFKPAAETSLVGVKLYQLAVEAGLPPGRRTPSRQLAVSRGAVCPNHAGLAGLVARRGDRALQQHRLRFDGG